MDTKDKKIQLLDILSKTTDSDWIHEVYDILHPGSAIEDIKMEDLPGELQQKINNALDDYKSGNYISHDVRKQNYNTCLPNNPELPGLVHRIFKCRLF